jgi:berberine-like enzyme
VIANVADGYHQGAGEPTARSALIRHLTPQFAAAAVKLLDSGAVHWFQIRTVGGAAWADLVDHFDGLYLSFETDQDPARITEAFPPATLARLRELKLRYDPDNVFRDNFTIKAATR